MITLKFPNAKVLSEEEFVKRFVSLNNLKAGSKLYSVCYNEVCTIKYIQDKWIWLEDEDGEKFRIGSQDIWNLGFIFEDN